MKSPKSFLAFIVQFPLHLKGHLSTDTSWSKDLMATFGRNLCAKTMVRSSARVILGNVIIFVFSLIFGLKPRTFSCCLEKGMNTCQYVSCICVHVWHTMFYVPVANREDLKLVSPLLSANF